MKAAIWLAFREIAGTRASFLLGVAVVAAVVGLSIGTDALGRGGEERVAVQMDAIAAPIEVLPADVSATQLARGEIGSASLPPDAIGTIRAVLEDSLRAIEARLVLETTIAGHPVLLVGTTAIDEARDPEVEVGATLSERMGLRPGETTTLLGKPVRIGAVLPSTGTIDDGSFMLPLRSLQRLAGQEGRINHARLFLRAGVDSAAARNLLEKAGLAANFIRRDRGDAVDREAPRSLGAWRAAAFAAAALACAAWLAFSTRLNLAERRRELATLSAIGARFGSLMTAVVLRATATAALGALIGSAIGIALGRLVQARFAGGEDTVILTMVALVVLSAAVAAPAAAMAARADPVDAIEEQ